MKRDPSTFQIGQKLQVRRFGFGALQLTGKGAWGDPADREYAKKVLKSAVAAGVNFIDTADSYGPYTNELLIQEALHDSYDKIVIATKGGFTRTGPDQWEVNGRPEHIRQAIDGSLKRLKRDQIDLWQLHRIDSSVPLEETLKPVMDAVAAGKIRFVGLSEVSIDDIQRAEKIVPIVSVQNLYNLANRSWEEVIDYTAKREIAFIPWFPLASGPDRMKSLISPLTKKYQATVAQLALAWLFKRSPNILLIPGTSSLEHLQINVQAEKINLSDEDFRALDEASR